MMVGIAFHILAAVIWVGGMFFAIMILRPSVGSLESSARLTLWRRVLSRFFPWVWLCVAVLLASGVAMVFLGFGNFAAAGTYVHAMMATGLLRKLCVSGGFGWADGFFSFGRRQLIVVASDVGVLAIRHNGAGVCLRVGPYAARARSRWR